MAMAYDTFLIVSMWMVLAFIIIYPMGQATDGEQGRYIMLPLMLLSNGFFYGWFWSHGGQTLGMRVWRIKATGYNSEKMSRAQIGLRYVLSVIGFLFFMVSYFWVFFDSQKRTLAERLSGTRSILLNK